MLGTAKIAWRNIWRHPRRTFLTVFAISFACMLLIFSVSFQYGTYDAMVDSAIQIQTGHVQIQNPSFKEEKKIYQVIENPQPVLEQLNKLPGLQAVAPRCEAYTLVSSKARTHYAAIIGIESEQEKQATKIARVMQKGEYLTAQDTDKVLVGELLAKNLAAKVGDELVLIGQGRNGSVAADSLIIKGIFRTGDAEFDRLMVYMPIKRFQETFFMDGAIHSIMVLGKKLGDIPEIKKEIDSQLSSVKQNQPLEVYTWPELLPGLDQMIKVDMTTAWITYIILVIVVAFSIMNTFYMGIFERTREFGMLLALGMRQRQIAQMVFVESCIMTLVGLILGILFGMLISYYFHIHGISMGQELLEQWGISSKIFPILTPFTILFSPFVILIFTLLTAIVPILKIFRIQPAEAMRVI